MDKLETADDLLQAFRSYNIEIFKYVYFNVNRKKEIAEDITQDVFMRVWEYRKSFNPEKGSLRTWIYRIARNKIYDHYKEFKDFEDIDFNDVAEEENNENDNQIMSHEIIRDFDKLTKFEKDLLTLRYVQELDIDEIAVLIDKNYNTTKVAIHRVLNKLKNKIILNNYE